MSQLNSHAYTKRTLMGLIGVALIGALGASAAFGATILGQVRAHDGGAGIEQAVVELDKLPADGVAESSAVTDLFGFFRFDEVPAGRYVLTTMHSDYATTVQTNSLESTEVLNVVIELKSAEETAAKADGCRKARLACVQDPVRQSAPRTCDILAPRRSIRYRRKASDGASLLSLPA